MMKPILVSLFLLTWFSPIAVASDSMEVDLDYMLWWTNGGRLPALVSTSPTGTPQNSAGVLPNATVLFGESEYFDSLRNGGRVNVTRWLESDKCIGLDLGFFGAGSSGDGDYASNSNGVPILARPFFNTASNLEDSQLVAFTDPSLIPLVAGNIRVSTSSEFHSGNALVRFNSCQTPCNRVDLLLGYRFFRYREGINISESLESTNPFGLIQQGTTLDLYDDFSSGSNFHGGDIGIGWSRIIEWFSIKGSAKIAMGNVQKRLRIQGQTTVNVPSGGTSVSSGGLLALPSNIGNYTENDFAFLPEVGVKGVACLTKNLDVSIGYTALCLTNVGRIGTSIDRRVDTNQLNTMTGQGTPGVTTPRATISDSVFFANGISFGVGLTR